MKSTELITFENPVIGTIRGFIDKNGEPWFLAAQVCRCLGIKNSAKAVSDLKQRMKVVEDYYKTVRKSSKSTQLYGSSENRGVTSSYSPKSTQLYGSSENRDIVSNRSPNWGCKTISLQEGKNHTQLTIINEQWLYELIFASRKQTAIVFRSWVTGEVLPSLRKHGEYRMEGKLIRRSLTDTLKDSGENKRMHGFGYSTYSRLVNKSLGLPEKIDRNNLPDEILEKIARREDLVRTMVAEGKNYIEIRNYIQNNLSA